MKEAAVNWDDPPLEGIACPACGVEALRLDDRRDPAYQGTIRTWTVCFACGAKIKGSIRDDNNPLDGIPCRECGVAALRVEWRLTAKPFGTFSLAGNSMKVTAADHPWAVCDACGAESEGKR